MIKKFWKNKKFKEYWTEKMFLLFCGVLYFLFYKFYDKLSIDFLYWLFSTILQSFFAFVSLMGMIIVYKLQIVQKQFDDLAKLSRDFFSGVYSKVAFSSSDDLLSQLKNFDYSKFKNRPDIRESLKMIQQELKSLDKNKLELKDVSKRFFLTSFILLVSNLIFLSLSPLIVNFDFFVSLFVTLSITISLIVIWFGYELIKKLI